MSNKAQEIIFQLHAEGFNNAKIARAIGRDSSIVSQIAKGKKTGSHYVDALQEMLGGRDVPSVPRRTDKHGQIASVRTQNTIRDKTGSIDSATSSNVNVLKVTIEKLAQQNAQISLVIAFAQFQKYGQKVPTAQSVSLYAKGGYNANYIASALQHQNFNDFILQQVQKAHNPDVAKNIVSVTINVIGR